MNDGYTGRDVTPDQLFRGEPKEARKEARWMFQEITHRCSREEADFRQRAEARRAPKGWSGEIQTTKDGPWHTVVTGTAEEVMRWAWQERQLRPPPLHVYTVGTRLHVAVGRVRWRVLQGGFVADQGMTEGEDGEKMRRVR